MALMTAVLKAGGAVAAACWLYGRQPGQAPNLLFTTDQHLWGDRAHGTAGVKTLNIDRIAAEGVRFDRSILRRFPFALACEFSDRPARPQPRVVTNDVILSDAVPSLGAH